MTAFDYEVRIRPICRDIKRERLVNERAAVWSNWEVIVQPKLDAVYAGAL